MKILNFKLKIFTFLFVIFIFYILFFIFSKAFAQTNGYYLSVVPYQTREDLDVLFAQSSRVLDYFEGEGVEEPIFLTIITEPQRQYLTNKNYRIRILDSLNNLNDIGSYTLLYHPQPDQSNLLINLGKVFVVSKHYTLLKTSSEKPFKYEGVVAKFFIIPFAKQVVTPPYRNKTIVPTKPPLPTIVPIKKPSLIKTIFVSLLLSLIITAVIYHLRGGRLARRSLGVGGMDSSEVKRVANLKLSITIFIILFTGLFLIISLFISKLSPKPNYPTSDLEIKETEEF